MNGLLQKIQNSQFLRFAIVGTAGFVVDESVLWLMRHAFDLGPLPAGVISTFSAMTFTWWGNRTLTFSVHAASILRNILVEWLRFIAANAVGAGINFITFVLMVEFAPMPLNNAYLAKAAGAIVGLIFNFTLSKRFVFRA